MAQLEYLACRLGCRAGVLIIVGALAAAGLTGPAWAEEKTPAPAVTEPATGGTENAGLAQEVDEPVADGPPVYLAVTGVRSDDVLHLRDVPSADSKSLAGIPPNARDLKKIGCMRVQLSMDRYMYMSKEERRHAQAPWCRVEYKGMQGWVSARYVKEQGTAKR